MAFVGKILLLYPGYTTQRALVRMAGKGREGYIHQGVWLFNNASKMPSLVIITKGVYNGSKKNFLGG